MEMITEDSFKEMISEPIILPKQLIYTEAEAACYTPPTMKCNNKIGDRIVIANTVGCNTLPFGSYGTIIGYNSEHVLV